MHRTYKIETDTYFTTIVLTFPTDFFEAGIFREVFFLDSRATVSVSVTGDQPFVVVTILNQPEESLTRLIEMIEAAGFATEVPKV